MLSAVLVALTLDGALPGLVRVRRPVPFVRYDRVREPRARAQLRDLARRLLESEELAVPTPFGDCRRCQTRSAAGSTGARIAFFLNG